MSIWEAVRQVFLAPRQFYTAVEAAGLLGWSSREMDTAIRKGDDGSGVDLLRVPHRLAGDRCHDHRAMPPSDSMERSRSSRMRCAGQRAELRSGVAGESRRTVSFETLLKPIERYALDETPLGSFVEPDVARSQPESRSADTKVTGSTATFVSLYRERRTGSCSAICFVSVTPAVFHSLNSGFLSRKISILAIASLIQADPS